MLDAAGVDVAAGEDAFFFGAEVLADDADDADTGEVAGGEGKVGGCASETAVPASGGGFDGVKRDAAYDKNGHWVGLFLVVSSSSSDTFR